MKVIKLCERYENQALIVVDETYVEFSEKESFITIQDRFDNLVVLRTLSKSHAAAGIRCGVAVASSEAHSLQKFCHLIHYLKQSRASSKNTE